MARRSRLLPLPPLLPAAGRHQSARPRPQIKLVAPPPLHRPERRHRRNGGGAAPALGARARGGRGERRGLALVSVSVSPPTPRQFWKLCITSCHRRQPAGAAHKQTPAAPPAPKRGEPRGAAPTDGRGEESPCRQRVPWAATRRFVSHRKRRGRPREAQTVTGLRDPAAAGRGARGRSRLGGRGAPAAASAFQRPPRRSIFPRRTPRAERRTAGGRSPPGAAPRPRQVCTAPPTWPLSPRAPLNSPSAGGRGGAGHPHREGPLHLLPAAPPPPNPGPSDNLCPVPTRAIFTLSKRFFPLRVPTGARRKRAAPRTAPPPAVSGGAAPGRAGPR